MLSLYSSNKKPSINQITIQTKNEMDSSEADNLTLYLMPHDNFLCNYVSYVTSLHQDCKAIITTYASYTLFNNTLIASF